METKSSLNLREHDRYFINEIPVEGIGSIVEISRKGLKIRKAPDFTVEGQILNFKISTLELQTNVRWEDGNFIGLQVAGGFNDPKFIMNIVKLIKRPKETIIPPQMSVPDEAIQQYKKDEVLTMMVDLLMEVDCPEPNITKIGICIDEISALQKKNEAAAEKEKGDEKTEEKTEENTDEKTEEVAKKQLFLKDELIARATALKTESRDSVVNVNFAINLLGYDRVRKILRDYMHKKIFKSEDSASVFQDFETYNILKSAIFRNLCHIFGLSDIQPEGNALLFCEMIGVDILAKESCGMLDNFYTCTSRLYSEVSLLYEKALFGVDPLEINKYYFEKSMGAFKELYDGYVLAHDTLNPHYSPPEKIKLSLTQKGLVFSYIAYLTFLALEFLMDRDTESGFVLIKRLKGNAMDDRKINELLNESVSKANSVLREFGIKGSIAIPRLPIDTFKIDSYLGKDIRFSYLLKAFRKFKDMNLKRMALRYEDPYYAHFVLGKIINAEGPGLNSKRLIVVPCRNVTEDNWHVKDFTFFDLLVFKDITKLKSFAMSSFLKLWSSFEGQIIVTFSNLDILDYTNPGLYSVFNNCLVDFPSYFTNDTVYRQMIGHTINYMKPYIGEQKVDGESYLNGVYTMDHIKRDILLNKEIS
jgi:hypothetical protein